MTIRGRSDSKRGEIVRVRFELVLCVETGEGRRTLNDGSTIYFTYAYALSSVIGVHNVDIVRRDSECLWRPLRLGSVLHILGTDMTGLLWTIHVVHEGC